MIELKKLSQLVRQLGKNEVVIDIFATSAAKGVKICEGWMKEYAGC
ncbi:hypothetical protein SAMN05446037_100536 [Anaerovirgula multivorans]|uniref:Uncharacterized protein n=1 Tax=Anaerovirgula multivorans TaxID=312168 RepID=A0A239C8Y3_9FIRM|nr:hypothetical protein [Anaerovirgula multivorans]SNS15823.1 hypothetical protein SAMN05446037_100536 [Anaerovirgula multivorans]